MDLWLSAVGQTLFPRSEQKPLLRVVALMSVAVSWLHLFFSHFSIGLLPFIFQFLAAFWSFGESIFVCDRNCTHLFLLCFCYQWFLAMKVFCVFETRFHYVGQAGLELILLLQSPGVLGLRPAEVCMYLFM